MALCGNEGLGDEGIRALTAALATANPFRLTDLHLSRTGMGDDGCAALVDLVPKVSSLEVLVIGGNKFGEGALGRLQAVCVPRRIQLMEDRHTASVAVQAAGKGVA